jgi:hypothetical protein
MILLAVGVPEVLQLFIHCPATIRVALPWVVPMTAQFSAWLSQIETVAGLDQVSFSEA